MPPGLFGGGGGGGGHENNMVGTAGGNGGGIVIVLADMIAGNGFAIRANGQAAAATYGAFRRFRETCCCKPAAAAAAPSITRGKNVAWVRAAVAAAAESCGCLAYRRPSKWPPGLPASPRIPP
jgi:hypothetical protein